MFFFVVHIFVPTFAKQVAKHNAEVTYKTMYKQTTKGMMKFIQTINVRGSIMAMGVGDILVFPFQKIKPNTVRANVSRIRKETGRKFKITQNSIGSKTAVERTE